MARYGLLPSRWMSRRAFCYYWTSIGRDMTTPVTFGTPFQIISKARKEAGYLGRGRNPDSDTLAEDMNTLTYIFNFLQVKPGLKLWLNQDLPITPVVGQYLYTLGPTGNVPMTKPIRGFEAYYTD